jgi:HlyD family secretion protein
MLVLIGTALSSACTEQARPAGQVQVAAVVAGASRPSAVKPRDTLRGSCTLRARKVVRLKAQVGGEIASVSVGLGDAVREGQVLASIDPENLNLRRERAALELQRLVAKAELLKFQIARAEAEQSASQALAKQSGLSAPAFGREIATLHEKRLDMRDNEISQAVARLDLRTVEHQLRMSTIKAPFGGVVMLRAAEPGMVVASASETFGGSEVLFEIGDPHSLLAACLVKEADAGLLQLGTSANLVVDARAAEPVAAKVSRIAPTVISESGLARREFELSLDVKALRGLLPGMHAIVDVDLPN